MGVEVGMSVNLASWLKAGFNLGLWIFCLGLGCCGFGVEIMVRLLIGCLRYH